MVVGKITVKMAPVRRIMRRMGVTETGDIQQFHTQNVLRRIRRYMPFRSGVLSSKLTLVDSPTSITAHGLYARYQYFGKVMVGRAPKTVTDKNLVYSTHKNALAGPFWDRRLVASERKVMQKELQDYIKRRAAK